MHFVPINCPGIIDHSSHDFLIGLMGEHCFCCYYELHVMPFLSPLPETQSWCLCAGGMGDSFAPDPYTDTIGMPLHLIKAFSDPMPTCLINATISADHMGFDFQVESTG